jgi:diguanylate cyclase (GGDEF)-like protein
MKQDVRSRAFRRFTAIQALVLAAFFFTPLDSSVHLLWQVLAGFGAVAVVVAAVRRQPHTGSIAWQCLAAGVLSNATGILVEGLRVALLGVPQWPPSPADPFYLGLYPWYAAGLITLIRHRSPARDWAALVDTAIITTGCGLLCWVFLIRPSAFNAHLPLLGRVVVTAYPVADLVMAGLLVHLLLGSGRRSPAVWLLAGGLVCVLGLDIGWAAQVQLKLELSSFQIHLLEAAALANYGLIAAAALHPSAQEIALPAPPRPPGLRRPLLAGLTVAVLIAPALLAVESWRGRVADGAAIAVGSAMLFLLVVTRMVQLVRRIEGQARLLGELALVDDLTGLPNRRAWSSALPLAIERARRTHAPLAVALIDLDHFKRFNDSYGHPAGDELLRTAAAAWRERVRLLDQLARYGGEEFILTLPDADAGQADAVIERLRAVTPLGQTFSAGVAVWDEVESIDSLVARADRALYGAKQTGRNRTVLA